MRKIGIIGLGHVGAALAYTLVIKGITDELVLIDKTDRIAYAEKLDLENAQIGLQTHTQITIQDYCQLRDAAIVIIASAEKTPTSRSEIAIKQQQNQQMLAKLAPQIMASGFYGILLNMTDPCDVMSTELQRLTNLPQQQVFGIGTLLDSMCMQRTIAETLFVSPQNVQGYMLGEHADQQFTAWSTINVNTQPIANVLGRCKLDYQALETTIQQRAEQIITGKGYINYSVATAIILVIQAIFSDAHLLLPLSSWDPLHQVYISQPTLIGRPGVLRIIDVALTASEQQAFEQAASSIQHKLMAEKTTALP